MVTCSTVNRFPGRRLFASYAREDERVVRQLVKLIGVSGAFVFLDQEQIPPGSDWQLALNEGIVQTDALIVFWSRNAVGSEWVRREWEFALRLGKVVIPVRLDASDLPSELNRLQAIDLRVETDVHGLAHKTVLRSILDPWEPDEFVRVLYLCSEHLRDELSGQLSDAEKGIEP